jgi:uncharacterized protein
MGQYPRTISTQITEYIEDSHYPKNVLAIAGARQIGKTTTLEAIVADRPTLFLNLEKTPSMAAQIDQCTDFRDFDQWIREEQHFDPSQQILVIDEAQHSRRLGSFIRFMKEEWKTASVILTGSLLSELYAETVWRPVGRETFFEMWPMTFTEFLQAMGQESLVHALHHFHLGDTFTQTTHTRCLHWFGEYLQVGGLPEVVAYYQEEKDYRRRRADIYKAYEDDFVRYFSLDEVNLFRRCLEAVAAHVGTPSKDTQVVALDRPGYKKVASILARLEKWRLIIKCDQRGQKAEKIQYYPKRYVYDVGILGDLRMRGFPRMRVEDIATPTLRTPIGGLIENAVAISLRAQCGEELHGLKLSSRSEIDFAIRVGNVVHPVECKIALKMKGQFLKGIHAYRELCNAKPTSFILYGGPPRAKARELLHALPFYLSDEVLRLLSE